MFLVSVCLSNMMLTSDSIHSSSPSVLYNSLLLFVTPTDPELLLAFKPASGRF